MVIRELHCISKASSDPCVTRCTLVETLCLQCRYRLHTVGECSSCCVVLLLSSALQRSLEEQLLQVRLCTILVFITVTILLHAAVMQELPPSSRIYLLGETKTFTCQGTGNPASLLINSHNPVGDNTVTENLKSNNITWIKTLARRLVSTQ